MVKRRGRKSFLLNLAFLDFAKVIINFETAKENQGNVNIWKRINVITR